jgi:hypothetical protein
MCGFTSLCASFSAPIKAMGGNNNLTSFSCVGTRQRKAGSSAVPALRLPSSNEGEGQQLMAPRVFVRPDSTRFQLSSESRGLKSWGPREILLQYPRRLSPSARLSLPYIITPQAVKLLL